MKRTSWGGRFTWAILGLFWSVSAVAFEGAASSSTASGGALNISVELSRAQIGSLIAPMPEGHSPFSQEISLKVALPAPDARLSLDAVSQTSEEKTWPRFWPKALAVTMKEMPWARLGVRGEWRGIPYQEILMHPLAPGSREATFSLSARGSLLVRIVAGNGHFASTTNPSTLTKESPLFVNPADVHPVSAKPHSAYEESNVSTLAEGALSASPSFPPPGILTPLLRISINQDGLYRLDYSTLTGLGFNPSLFDPRDFHLLSRGAEIPILVEGESDGHFDPADDVIFYGQELSITNRAVWNGGDFTNTNVYWLYADSTPGARMASLASAPTHGFPSITKTQATFHLEQNSRIDTVDHLRPNGDVWFWAPSLCNPAIPPTYLSSQTYSAVLPHAAGGDLSVRAVVAGTTTLTHSVSLAANGANPSSGTLNPYTWAGVSISDTSRTYSGLIGSSSSPGASASISLLLTLNLPSSGQDWAATDFFELTYSRYLASDSGALLFSDSNANATYSATGFSSLPYALDISAKDSATGLALPVLLTGGSFSSGTLTFEMAQNPSVASRQVALSCSPLAPLSSTVAAPSSLSDPSNAADLLILTTPDFESSDPSSAWQRYIARRSAAMRVKVVEAQDVYDNFSYGIFDPTAFKSFFNVIGSSWLPANRPKYVLIFGDGTYDYKNYLGTSGFKNFVPTMMFEDMGDSQRLGRYASDCWYTDWNGDGYPDAAAGRIPATSFASSEAMLSKIMGYEDQALSGSWFSQALLVSDQTDSEGQNFEALNDTLASAWLYPPWTSQKIYYGQPPYNGSDSLTCASDIRNGFPNCALTSYVGHGLFYWWGYYGGSASFFTSDKVRNSNTQSDIDLLSPTTHLPFVIMGTCYASAFDEPNTPAPAIAKDLFSRPDRGSIGSCGNTTIGYLSEDNAFSGTFFQQAFGMYKVRVDGDLVEAGRFSLPSSDTRGIFNNVTIGDPSLALRLPAPPPPASLAAASQNAAVQLSWTAPSPAASNIRLYRSSNGGTSWTLVAPAIPGTQTSYTDGSLINATAYYYYTTSLDSSGFEGPPSNIASATPLNPNPPAAPTGLAATDTGNGDSLNITWNANTESDLNSYTLWWGTSSGSYANSQNYPKTTTTTLLAGLTVNTRYYFVLTATNTSGKTSSASAEASGMPTGLRLAIRPPAMITDLMVTRSGSDLVLTWSKPLVDVGGQPCTVASFQVFRVVNSYNWNLDTVSTSAPNAMISIPATSATSYNYTDTGAVALAGTVTYLVVALDASGNRSPASNPPPSPILGLKVAKNASCGAQTEISFTAVGTTLGGGASLVDHYNIYGFYPMSHSSDHVKPSSYAFLGTLPAAAPGATVTYCDGSGAIPIFYTAVAVDNRGNTSLY